MPDTTADVLHFEHKKKRKRGNEAGFGFGLIFLRSERAPAGKYTQTLKVTISQSSNVVRLYISKATEGSWVPRN